MRSIFLVVLYLTAVLCLGLRHHASADVVILKNGNSIEGLIELLDRSKVVVKLGDHGTVVLKRAEVDRAFVNADDAADFMDYVTIRPSPAKVAKGTEDEIREFLQSAKDELDGSQAQAIAKQLTEPSEAGKEAWRAVVGQVVVARGSLGVLAEALKSFSALLASEPADEPRRQARAGLTALHSAAQTDLGEVQRLIADAIRRFLHQAAPSEAPHSELPPAERLGKSAFVGQSELAVYNDTSEPMTVSFSGPEEFSFTLPPRTGCRLNLKNGVYSETAAIPSANPFRGVDTYTDGRYSHHLYRVGTVPQVISADTTTRWPLIRDIGQQGDRGTVK